MKTVFVTGAAGFIGSHLVERLLKRGDGVVGLDSFNDFYDPSIKRANVHAFEGHPNWMLLEGDIRDPEVLEEAFKVRPITDVVHLAARAGVRPSVEQPELYSDVNLTGTIRVLEAARVHRISRFVFASSSSVYGGSIRVPFTEEDPVELPESPYAATKRAGELICKAFHHLNSPDGVLTDVPCLRFFTVYGPRQRPEMAISKFTALLLSGTPIPMFGDGSTLRDYTYVEDIVDGISGALDHATGFDVFNIGGTHPIRLDEMIELVGKAVGVKPSIEHHPMQPGDVLVTSADCTHAKDVLGYSPKVSFEEGVARYVDWHKKNRL